MGSLMASAHAYHLARAAVVGWSDREPAGGATYAALLAAHGEALSGHVVVAGPHAPDVLEVVRTHARRATLLVRGSDDAAATADRYAGDGVEVICGDHTDLRLDRPADALVLLDGLERVPSTETDDQDWRTVLDRLRAQAVPDAALWLRVDNRLSARALALVPSRRARDDDDAWVHLAATPGRPDDVGRLAAETGGGWWSLFGDPRSPAAILRPGATVGSGAAALAVAASPVFAGGAIDERGVVFEAAAVGRLDEVAPGWLVTPAAGTAGGFTAQGPVEVDGAGLLFEEAFLERSARHDDAGCRELVRTLAAFLDTDAAATPDRLLLSPQGELRPLPLPAAPTAMPAAADPLVTACIRLAVRLRQLGIRHPGPTSMDAAELASLLLAFADREIAPEGIADLIESSPRAPLTPDGARLVLEQTASVRERERSFRQALDLHETRLVQLEDQLRTRAEELATARKRLARARERADAAQSELDALRSSRSWRAVQTVTKPARTLRDSRTRPEE